MIWFWKKKFIIPPLGCRKEPTKMEDYQIREILRAYPPFDWNKGYDVEEDMGQKIIIKNQWYSGSCVFQSWGYYGGALEAFEIGKYIDYGARRGYSLFHLPEGGAYLRDGGDFVTNTGMIPSAMFPDKQTEVEMRDSGDWRKDLDAVAKIYLKGSYLLAPPTNMNELASLMQMGKGFVVGIFDDFNESWRTTFPKPGLSANQGHAMYFCKSKLISWKNNEPYFGSPNSWGEGIGDKGWQWFGAEWLRRMFFMRVIRDLPSEVERPLEKPKYFFAKDLKWGMKDPDVEALQRCLASERCFLYPEFTDYFGGYTLKAVKSFQAKYGIEPISGYVGLITRAKLNELFA